MISLLKPATAAILSVLLFTGMFLQTATTHSQPLAQAGDSFQFESFEAIDVLFAEAGYTPETWQAGIRQVPRLYLTHIPERWRSSVSKEISVATKKRLFFRTLGPLVLRANELIEADRQRLQTLPDKTSLNDEEREWLNKMAVSYRVGSGSDTSEHAELIENLLIRVDIIPPALALAQAAEESGWGTSRFADLGNALFGQWTWGGKGIVPREQRSGKGNYKIAAFESPQESVNTYMLNLNSHPAYVRLRSARAELRAKGHRPTGAELVGTLIDYSERREEYVESLKTIMRVNRLAPTDSAYLGDGPPLYLEPVGAGGD